MGLFRRHKQRGSSETMNYGAKLITVAKPQNPVSEQFRTIKTNINFMAVDHKIKSLAFTSANISEGKSTVTANVAVAYAQAGKSVLLIDADLHRPTLHQTFDLTNSVGLTTILTSDAEEINMEEVIKPGFVTNLSVLTSGPLPPNPSELLSSNRMQEFLKLAKDHYDLVILDLAPILEVSDTQALTGSVDGIVLVVRQGITQKAGVKRAIEMINLTKTKLLGYVLNDVRSGADGGYGYGYGYGYGEEKKD